MTGSFKFMFLDARGNPFPGKVNITLNHTVLKAPETRRNIRNHPGDVILKVPDLESTPDGRYDVRVSAARHRTVGRFLQVLDGGTSVQVFHLPIDPGEVKSVKFPKFNELPGDLQQLLNNSQVQTIENLKGAKLYEELKKDEIKVAGLLNIHAKLRATRFGNGRTVASYFSSLIRVRGDRIFAKVQLDLSDEVKNSVVSGLFQRVSGAAHQAPQDFDPSSSFKTRETYGNLQLTFFLRKDALEFQVDADLDDAQGVEHIFQVVGHAVTGGETHPYDIHEILLAHHGIDPGYELAV